MLNWSQVMILTPTPIPSLSCYLPRNMYINTLFKVFSSKLLHKMLPTNDYLPNRVVLKVFNLLFFVTTTLKRQFRQFANSSTNSNKSLFLRKISSLKKLQKIDFIFKKKSKCFSRYLKVYNKFSFLSSHQCAH